MKVIARTGATTLVAHGGDGKTLLGFDRPITPPGGASDYLLNDLRYANPSAHAQDPKEPPHHQRADP